MWRNAGFLSKRHVDSAKSSRCPSVSCSVNRAALVLFIFTALVGVGRSVRIESEKLENGFKENDWHTAMVELLNVRKENDALWLAHARLLAQASADAAARAGNMKMRQLLMRAVDASKISVSSAIDTDASGLKLDRDTGDIKDKRGQPAVRIIRRKMGDNGGGQRQFRGRARSGRRDFDSRSALQTQDAVEDMHDSAARRGFEDEPPSDNDDDAGGLFEKGDPPHDDDENIPEKNFRWVRRVKEVYTGPSALSAAMQPQALLDVASGVFQPTAPKPAPRLPANSETPMPAASLPAAPIPLPLTQPASVLLHGNNSTNGSFVRQTRHSGGVQELESVQVS
eukprot:TRINITY_DN71062_c0_g1_i1.p1 TRINITY_DN71062_c0_g1~~TRINITY_DN71062_c0_g1_i1.p1  ORF type:complete len:339 (+),score=60.50 TRINITY_DN71062_c0_g1_i1:151-1167(+)